MLFLIFFISLLVLCAALLVPGLDDLLMIGFPSVVASLLLLLKRFSDQGVSLRSRKRWIILDGSNIMHWKGGDPDLATVQEAIERLTAEGYAPCVVFDANVGYKFCGRYQGEAELAAMLSLPVARVMVVPKGTPADQVILAAARDQKAKIVTNDRFRDWIDQYPEVTVEGHFVRGGYRAGQLWLNLPPT